MRSIKHTGRTLLVVAAAFFGVGAVHAQEPMALSGPGWRVWLDAKAPWKTDTLYLPDEVDLKTLPVNPPTGGWDVLDETLGMACSLPACVEEFFSGGTNAWRYHGVSWFWRDVDVPESWSGKRVYLDVDKARMRVELYVNGQLAGYDLVAETPLRFDVTPHLKTGQSNRLAFRVTNPGGSRGWSDFQVIKWGTYQLPDSHDFGGVGHVTLRAEPPVHVADVFVRNERPAGARRITVLATVNNTTPEPAQRTVRVAIDEATGAESETNITVASGLSTVAIPLAVPSAELWDMDHPKLYTCTVTLSGGGAKEKDLYRQPFGFRVFEVADPDGDPNFYLNGKRLRLRSAIDWGYYALTGFYATDEMARKSVEAARAIGHNSINFHRRIGEPLVFQHADKLGLYLYEEPGGFHIHQGNEIADGSFAAAVMLEKCRRMIRRDRNHPSLLIYCLSNEDNGWNQTREAALRMAQELDGTRMVKNTSGANVTGAKGPINYIRPYETQIRNDLRDDHTVQSASRFLDAELMSHQEQFPSNLVYWGEVRCYTGPANWVEVASMRNRLPDGRPGYDLNIYDPLAEKIADYWRACRVSQLGSRTIRQPSDVSRQAGRGLMYTDGRLGQAIMRNDNADGYAINGWSAGPQMPMAWDSAICDEGRNLKGPAGDFAYWTRPLQVVIARSGGKYFKPGDTAKFVLSLVNEGFLAAGEYTLKLTVTDGAGRDWGDQAEMPVTVLGGESHAQFIAKWNLPMKAEWRGGYITIKGRLEQEGRTVADGTEQVLLAHRPSFKDALAGMVCAVHEWPAALAALTEAGAAVSPFVPEQRVDALLAGQPPADAAVLEAMLAAVKEQGTLLLVRMDEAWAAALHARGLLAEPVTQWGGKQSRHWNGNGWGYLDHFIGDQAIPSGSTIGTTSWEVPDDPRGFAPFQSALPQGAYGAYFARKEWHMIATHRDETGKIVPLVTEDTLLVLLGTLDYGKGKIVMQAAYPVDQNNAFSDLLFYNLISKGVRNEW